MKGKSKQSSKTPPSLPETPKQTLTLSDIDSLDITKTNPEEYPENNATSDTSDTTNTTDTNMATVENTAVVEATIETPATPEVTLTPEQIKEQVKFHSDELTRLTGERDAAVKVLVEEQTKARNELHKSYNDQIYTHDRFVGDLKAKILKDIQERNRAIYIAEMADLGITVTDLPGAPKAAKVSDGTTRTRTSSGEVETKILEACRVAGGLGLSDIEEKTSLPYTTIQKNTEKLVADGKLVTNGLERKAKKYSTV